MKKMFPLLLLAAIALLIGGWYMSHPKKSKDIVLYGNVDVRQISLAFSESQRVTQMTAEEGDAVKEGQIIATLDTEALLLDISRTQAQIEAQEQALLRLVNGTRPEEISQLAAKVESAKAEADLARNQLRRTENAFKESSGKAISQQDRDNARASDRVAKAHLAEAQEALKLAQIGPREEDIAQAKAQLNSLKAALELQNYQVRQSQLKAPADSVVRSRLLEPGDMASPQRPVYLLAVTDPKWVRAYIQEDQLGLIHPGLEVDVLIDSYPDKTIPGQIGYISSVAEFTPKTVQTQELRTSLLYEIRVIVKDPDNIMRLGMPATVKLKPTDPETEETN